jgi:hypothetical protein
MSIYLELLTHKRVLKVLPQDGVSQSKYLVRNKHADRPNKGFHLSTEMQLYTSIWV